MKPLSPFNFIKKNRKSFLSSLIAICLSVILVYCTQCFLQSMFYSNYKILINFLSRGSIINTTSDSEGIKKSIIDSIKKDEAFDYIMPIRTATVRYVSQGGQEMTYVFRVLPEDINYIMKKYDVKLVQGRMPKEGEKEYVLDEMIAKNNKKKLGDKIDDNLIVGIVKSDYYMSFSSYARDKEEVEKFKKIDRDSLISRASFVFAKIGKEENLMKKIASFSKKEVKYKIISEQRDDYNESLKSSQEMFNLISFLIIFVMVVTMASTKYAQFVNRRQEFGILNAIGYDRLKIMKMVFEEVAVVNVIGFIMGILISILLSYGIGKVFFESIGSLSIHLSLEGFLYSILIPLFSIIFSLIPIYKVLGNLDAINIIEEV